MPKQYKIDSVSNLYPAMGGYVFRLCAVLREDIDAALLRRAVRHVAPQFPIMCSHLERTFMSYVHVAATDLDVVSYGEPPIHSPDMFDTEKPSFRLYVRGKRLAMDVFHGNADGAAAVTFLKALTTAYCCFAAGVPAPPAIVPKAEVLEDPYKQYYKPAKAASLLEKESYRMRLPVPKNGGFYVRFSSFSMQVSDIKPVTKPHGCTVNDFLCAAVYFAILRATDAEKSGLPVTISVPLDLRTFYGSQTQRNFAFYINVRLHASECANDFVRAMQSVHSQVRAAAAEKGVRAGVATTYLAANNPATRLVPRAVREHAIRKVYRHVAGNSITTTLSNLGAHTLEGPAKDMVERFEIYLGAGYGGINTSAVGLGDEVTLCVACGSDSTVYEQALLDVLKEQGVPCKWEHFAYKNRELVEECAD